MKQQSPKRRSPRVQQQQRLEGPVVSIYSRQGNSQYPLPREIQPRDVVNFLMQNPTFQNMRGLLQEPDTVVEVNMYSYGKVVKGPFVVKHRQQSGPPLSQNGVPIPSENLGHLNPQSQMPPLPEEQFDQGIFDDRLLPGFGDEASYDQASAGELLRLKIDSLERQAEYLKSLVPIVDSFQVESPEELGMRELIRAGMEKE